MQDKVRLPLMALLRSPHSRRCLLSRAERTSRPQWPRSVCDPKQSLAETKNRLFVIEPLLVVVSHYPLHLLQRASVLGVSFDSGAVGWKAVDWERLLRRPELRADYTFATVVESLLNPHQDSEIRNTSSPCFRAAADRERCGPSHSPWGFASQSVSFSNSLPALS
jgi:hypothetical protein